MKHTLTNIFTDFDEVFNTLAGCQNRAALRSRVEGLRISEDEEHLYIDAPLAGVKPEDTEVTLDPKEKRLRIRGENHKKRENVKHHLKADYSYNYEIPLSHEIDTERAVEAVSKDGILSITLAKNRSYKPLRIDVTVA